MKNTLLLFILIASLSGSAQLPFFSATIKDSTVVNGYFYMVSNEHLLILDKYGAVIYSKSIPNGNNTDFKIQPNGTMSYFYGDKFWLMDSTFTIIDSVACKKYETDFHELMILPNKHFLLLGREKYKINISKYHWKEHQGTDTFKITSGIIQELDARRNVVFEWHSKDHFAFDDVDTFRYEFWDDPWWLHWNSLDVDQNGNILVSSRNFNEVTKINRNDGSILWRFGGKRNQFKFINCPVPFYGQRNIRVLANGNITFLDGGNGIQPHGARAMEFKLDEKKKTASLTWSYTYDSSFTTLAWGNVQRLSHSKTLIDFGGLRDTFTLSFVIVDSSANKLFQLNGPRSFRTYYYETLPFRLNRPEISCFDSLGVTYLEAAPGYKRYEWNTGNLSRTIAVKDIGDYWFFVPYGDGGFISSQHFVVSDISRGCKGKTLLK